MQAAIVDPAHAADDDAGPRRRPQDGGEHLLAPLRGHLLGVVQPGQRAAIGVREGLVVDQDRRGDQRPRQAAAPGLVGAGDEAAAEAAVEGEQAPGARQSRCRQIRALEDADPVRGPVGGEGLADDPVAGDGPPEAAVVAGPTVVAHHEVMVGRNH